MYLLEQAHVYVAKPGIPEATWLNDAHEDKLLYLWSTLSDVVSTDHWVI